MRKTYKYRLLGNDRTFSKAERWLMLCRHLYNAALEQRIMVYRQGGETLSCYDQIYQLLELKVDFPEYKEVSHHTLQQVLERLDRAYKAFFRRLKSKNGEAGFPRFKGRNRYDSFTLKQACWKLGGKYLTISNIGRFKLRLSRAIEGDIKTVTIRRVPSGKWYACFSCNNVPERKLEPLKASIGIDVGIKSFSTDSEGNTVGNPHYFREAQAILRRRQRKLSRRVKGSTRRNKARVLVAVSHEKVTNQRRDFLHKVANHYVANYGLIFIEDLNIKGMVKNHHLSKAINDTGWGTFFELLVYKAEEAGRKLLKVPAYNTSQICSGCGKKVPKSLAVRIHACPFCGLVMDRDENAARNISAVGQTAQAVTKEVTPCVA